MVNTRVGMETAGLRCFQSEGRSRAAGLDDVTVAGLRWLRFEPEVIE